MLGLTSAAIAIVYIIVLVVLSEALVIPSVGEAQASKVRAIMAVVGIIGMIAIPYIAAKRAAKGVASGVSSAGHGIAGLFK